MGQESQASRNLSPGISARSPDKAADPPAGHSCLREPAPLPALEIGEAFTPNEAPPSPL